METVFVGIGSNINRESNIQGGIRALEKQYGSITLSSTFETVPYGFEGDNFYNLVAAFETADDVHDIAARLRVIEYEFGRSRKEIRYSSRTLDIDLLLYGDLVLDDEKVRVPREDVLEYPFVLCPLAEICPEGIHPLEKKSYQQLWDEYQGDRDTIWKVNLPIEHTR